MIRTSSLVLAILTLISATAYAAAPSMMTAQGRITDSTGDPITGAGILSFRIFDAPVGGSAIWPVGMSENQPVILDGNGLWTVALGSLLPLTDAVFSDTTRYLEVTFGATTLPRVRLITGPYAHRVTTVDGSSGGVITSKVSIGPGHTNSGANAFIAGAINTASGSHATIAGGGENGVTGDYASIGGGRDNTVNSDSATIAGGAGNIIFAAARAATIGGGWRNANGGDFSFIGGGDKNTINANYSVIGGGDDNQVDGDSSIIAGGAANETDGDCSVIGGGFGNTILAGGDSATIAGGVGNFISVPRGSIGGGINDSVTGFYGSVPGGDRNVAGGICSFAAGRRAKARHHGTFVWADYGDDDFASTSQSQFLVQASGGVGVNTNAPFEDLTIDGSLAFKNGEDPGIYMFEFGPSNPNKMVIAHSPDFPTWGLQYDDAADRFAFLGNGIPVMTVDLNSTGGLVGFGSITSPSNIITLPNVNSAAGRALGFAWDEYSSRRWKTNIRPLEGSLEKVQRLQGVSYDPLAGGGRQIGLIAEEVGQIVPEVVQYEDNGVDAKSIDYSRLVSLLIEGMKEQQSRIEKLEETIRRMQP